MQEQSKMLDILDLLEIPYAVIHNIEEPIRLAKVLQYPLIVKASRFTKKTFPKIVHNDTDLIEHLQSGLYVSETYPLVLQVPSNKTTFLGQ